MLPPSVQNIIYAEGVPRLLFDQDGVRFVLRRVRCGFADHPEGCQTSQ
jgi:hypothetical protein